MNRAWVLIAGLVAGPVVATAGCQNTDSDKNKDKVQGRSQMEDPIGELDATTTVGSKTSVGNVDPIDVSGVGLVYGLPGTGSSPAPGIWRSMLENTLKKQGCNVSQILDDPRKSTSLVLVSARVMPGARKNELIDVEITLPEDSKTSSLKGGKLYPCELRNTQTTGNLNSMLHDGKPSGPSGDLKLGDVWAKAGGMLVAGVFLPADGRSNQIETDVDGQPVSKVARIWGGGLVTRSRPYYILMNPGDQNARMAYSIAERLNSTFHASAEPNLKVAEAKSKELIVVNVPEAYRHNHNRFLLVARQTPILPPRADSPTRMKLDEDLLTPRTTILAAIKLEALGGGSIRSLKVGLECPSPWVRFASAEALTYLGQLEGAAELGRLAEQYPALRAQCLKALASMNDAVCTDRLVELMSSPDPTLRYTAFSALRMADDNTNAVRGQMVNNAYWLHTAASGSPGLVHLKSKDRCEIVLFGDDIKLRGPFTLPIGSDYSIEVKEGADQAQITRIVNVKGKADLEEKKFNCTNDLVAVLIVLGKMGSGYDEAVELIRRADRAQVLSAPVVINAQCPELNINRLSEFAARDPALDAANREVTRGEIVTPGIDANGFDLPPPEPDPAAVAAPPPPKAPLNRNPGHLIFKSHESAPVIDPSVTPAGGP